MRFFAHELRKQVWAKIFGITGNVRPATELKQAIEQPGSPDSWKLIQRRAQANAALYEAAFPFVPGEPKLDSKGREMPVSILPTWRSDTSKNGLGGDLESPLPYEDRFWKMGKSAVSAAALKGLQGIRGTSRHSHKLDARREFAYSVPNGVNCS